MIDDKVFGERMDKLTRRFRHTVEDDILRDYFDFLTRQMDTEQFERACYTIFHYDTYWPTPVRFLEVAGIDPGAKAEAAWELVYKDARDGINRPVGEFDEATRAGIRAAGTPHALGMTNESQIPFARKRFIAAYRAHVTGGDSLPPGLTKGDDGDLPPIEGLG